MGASMGGGTGYEGSGLKLIPTAASVGTAIRNAADMQVTFPPEALAGLKEADASGDNSILELANGAGVNPVDLIRGLHKLCAQVQILRGFQPAPAKWCYSTDKNTEVPVVELTNTSPVNVTITNDQSGVGFEGGTIEVTAFKAGNTEDGEIIKIFLYGRQSQPEVFIVNAGTTRTIRHKGVWDNGQHYFAVRSQSGDATNPVQVVFNARAKAIDAEDLPVFRRQQPTVAAAIVDLGKAKMMNLNDKLQAHPSMQAVVGVAKQAQIALQGLGSRAAKVVKRQA